MWHSNTMDIRVRYPKLFAVAFSLLALLTGHTDGKRQLKVTNFLCQSYDENFAHFNSCSVKPIKRDVSEVNFHFKLNTIVKDNLMLNFYMKKRGNFRSPTVYNFTVDMCKFMEHRSQHVVMNLIYKLLGVEEYSNMNHSCPYEHDIVLKGYRFNEQYVNLMPIPLGQYWINMNWIYLQKQVVHYEIAFEFFDKIVYANRRRGAN